MSPKKAKAKPAPVTQRRSDSPAKRENRKGVKKILKRLLHDWKRKPSKQIQEIAEKAYGYICSKCEGPFADIPEKTDPKKTDPKKTNPKRPNLLQVARGRRIEYFVLPKKIRKSEPDLSHAERAYDMLRLAALRSAANEDLGREFLDGLNTGQEIADSFGFTRLEANEGKRVRAAIAAREEQNSEPRIPKAPKQKVDEFMKKRPSGTSKHEWISKAVTQLGASRSTIERRLGMR